ncbi:MAG: two-component system nitrogen regulation sensor histidine kinase NtrY [Alphaproteobacteria bacterium]|jgi:two-component system nitrogen regulation sensor histidine kinase NtrY
MDQPTEISRPSIAMVAISRLSDWGRRVGLGRKLSIALTVAALGSAFATYATITGSSPLGADTQTILILLQIDLVLFLLLGLVVARSLVGLWIERRRGQVGSRLHMRLVMLFSLIALAPAIIVSVFSAVFFNFGMENWFNDRVKTAIVESRAVAEAYLKEHQQVIRGDVLSMARDLERALPLMNENPRQFSRILAGQGLVRNLSEIYIFDGSGRVLAKWALGFVIDRNPVSPDVIDRARSGEVVLLTSEADDRLRAIIKLDRVVDAFLYVGRFVEPNVLEHIEKTQRAAAEYANIEGRRSSIEITFAMIFILVGMLLLFVAIWVGLVFANRLSRPISDLAGAAERVRAGDLSARVEEGPDSDELGLLSRAFNRMTDQLEGQRHELVQANRQLDERRHFIETVLGGVSAGVIGVDAAGHINLANRSACSLLATDIDQRIGADIGEVVPELAEMIQDAHNRPNRLVEAQISMQRVGRSRTLFVRLAADVVDGNVMGFVITFDDITELVAAQRKAAWSDVARRIAHEIKNPLTPIQLAAERLRRKYMSEIKSDPETFSNCTDTIIRQVGDIGRMVDEFSAFARMPRPEMESANLGRICREAMVLPRSAHPEITFVSEIPNDPVMVSGDLRQLSQVLTNLLQNAVDAIDGRIADGEEKLPEGNIRFALSVIEDDAEIEITDNGKGLPIEKRDRLTEPYITTRTKGTGLGLAIVKTILEDHGAILELKDRDDGEPGASIRVTIPLLQADDQASLISSEDVPRKEPEGGVAYGS